MFNIEDFDDVYVNFDRCLLNETIWIDIDGMMIRYEYNRLYVNGSIINNYDKTINELINAINEAVELLNVHNVSFVLAKDTFSNEHYDHTEYIAVNPSNLTGWLDNGYRLVAVVSR